MTRFEVMGKKGVAGRDVTTAAELYRGGETCSSHALGPEAKYEALKAISLAFITAVQLLPPRQRAVLILRDVLGYLTREVAGMCHSSEHSAVSAIKRARATLRRELGPTKETPPPPESPAEQQLAADFTRAYSRGDVLGVVALLIDDVKLAMPLLPLMYQGRELPPHSTPW